MAHVFSFNGHSPRFADHVWLAPTATVIGLASLGNAVSVWFGAVIRADMLAVVIGARTNVQDNAVIHITSGVELGGVDPHGVGVGTRIGDDVTIGHSAIVHGCSIGDRVLIGMGSIVLDGASVGSDVVIAAGTLVPPKMAIPDGVMVMGRPAKIVRPINDKDRLWSQAAAAQYVDYADAFARQRIGEVQK